MASDRHTMPLTEPAAGQLAGHLRVKDLIEQRYGPKLVMQTINHVRRGTRSVQTDGMRARATFRLWGDDAGLTAHAVTRKLGLLPTTAGEAGTRVGDCTIAVRDTSLWALSSAEEIHDSIELSEQLQRLLEVLEPATTELWELVNAGYHANWFCYVASHATEHAVELDRQLMGRLLALPGDLWLDVGGDGVDDE
jgi:hypothetical protein